MKPIYKILDLVSATLQVSLALQAKVIDGTEESQTPIPADILDSLRVELVAPNVSGARDLIKSGECTLYGNQLGIVLVTNDWLKGCVYRLQVSATFGTQTMVIYALDVTVPRYDALGDETQAYEDTVTVVSTVGDGGADATVYAKDADGNAHITKSLTVSGSVREGNPYGDIVELNVVVLTTEQKAEIEAATGTAYDYCDQNDAIEDGVNVTIYADAECTQKVGSTSKTEYAENPMVGDFFNLQAGESISAGTYYARKDIENLGNNSHAEGNATTASGKNSHAEGNYTTARGINSHAEGSGTTARGDHSHAEGNSTTASGDSSHAEGDNTNASGYSSHAEGAGTTARGINSHAEGSGTTASGLYSHAEGIRTKAIGLYSHAEGIGTIASKTSQHVCGQYNVEDTDDSYQFIVGNGIDNANRRNAFAVTKSGEIALFEANGTPVILDVAKLKALIASLS